MSLLRDFRDSEIKEERDRYWRGIKSGFYCLREKQIKREAENKFGTNLSLSFVISYQENTRKFEDDHNFLLLKILFFKNSNIDMKFFNDQ